MKSTLSALLCASLVITGLLTSFSSPVKAGEDYSQGRDKPDSSQGDKKPDSSQGDKKPDSPQRDKPDSPQGDKKPDSPRK